MAPTPIPPVRRTVLIGTESLLGQCGEVLLQHGHAVTAVVTRNHALRYWADERGIQAFADPTELISANLGQVDWLFGITHLAVLPSPVLSLARAAAVNFHDGPLPAYAGLNTPTWALINGEEEHGITWHLMTDAVDAGAILAQTRFPISPGETSVSLNAKCFAAALESFGAVVEKLERGECGSPQSAPLGRVYRRKDRPEAACGIDWSRPALEIDRVVRALDFGPYANPVGVATTWLRGQPMMLQSTEARAAGATMPPGTVIAVEAGGPRVATGSGELRIVSVRLPDGSIVGGTQLAETLRLEAGTRFEAPESSARAAWNQANGNTARHESFWVHRLTSTQSHQLPVGQPTGTTDRLRLSLELPHRLAERWPAQKAEAIGGVLAARLAALNGMERLSLQCSSPESRAAIAGAEQWFRSSVPVDLTVHPGESLQQCGARLGGEIAVLRTRGGLARDLGNRYPAARARSAESILLGLAIGHSDSAALLAGSELTIWVNSEGSEVVWLADTGRLDEAKVRGWLNECESFLREAVTRPDQTSEWERVVAVVPLAPNQLVLTGKTGFPPGRIQVVATANAPLDPALVEKAWGLVTERHEVLRTTLRSDPSGAIVQEIRAAVAPIVEVADCPGLTDEARAVEVARVLANDRVRPVELGMVTQARITILQLGPTHSQLVWSMPSVMLDRLSAERITHEVFSAYDGLRRGEQPIHPAAVSFRRFHEWLAGADSERDQRFWRARLHDFAGATPLPGSGGRSATPGCNERRLTQEESDGLTALARTHGCSTDTAVMAAWAVVVGRHAGADDVVFGLSRSARRKSLRDGTDVCGQLMSTAPIRVRLPADQPIASLLQSVDQEQTELRGHELGAPAELAGGAPLFLSRVVLDPTDVGGGTAATQPITVRSWSRFPLSLEWLSGTGTLMLVHDGATLGSVEADHLLEQVLAVLRAFGQPEQTIGQLSLLSQGAQAELLERWNATRLAVQPSCVHRMITQQMQRTPDRIAVSAGRDSLTYRELDHRANQLAHRLIALGVGPDQPVGLALGRTPGLLIGMIGIQKAGGAYLPLDPGYPADRLTYMLADSGARVLVTDREHQNAVGLPQGTTVLLEDLTGESGVPVDGGAEPRHLAYVIYTSGSTGKPKGVMVEHRNVVNFFAGMDQRLGTEPGTWLAVTSPSFDISVLELCWTLARGFTVVLAATDQPAALVPGAQRSTRPVSFSLFYFASGESNEGDKYRLLLEGARFADRNGFEAVWTPERHFHAFGGLYPNPAVAGAAVAAITERVGIRAGSVVLPLHHPIRVAEDWALVDNLSRGRVGISFASGWQPNDFVLRPEAFAKQKEVMFRELETVRRLWRGETLEFPGPTSTPVAVRTLPRPVQPELPFWITTAGNPESFEAAGRLGANLLTHLLGQKIEELATKLERYRKAWREAGHPGEGRVTLMLHTFVADDSAYVREMVRGPMVDYLKSSVSLIKHYAWAFPTFRNKPEKGDGGVDLSTLNEEELGALLDHAFDRYYETSGLFGTPDECLEIVDRVRSIGVDEVACLIDFGVPTDITLRHLEKLQEVHLRSVPAEGEEDRSIAAELVRHRVTHMQCTPVLARLLAAHPESHEGLRHLRRMMVGGEAFPSELAASLRAIVAGEIHNMYGPTETTIWSTTHRLNGELAVPLGSPIANTRVYVLDEAGRPVPVGVPGELWIGGDGVARGYLHRPELTAERFRADPFAEDAGARMYRTGDLVRWRADGTLEFLGRLDHQVKIRGFRIELGEIESCLQGADGVADAVVVARGEPGDQRLVAYVLARGVVKDSETLRNRLREALPEYMVPAQIVWLDAMPLTPNGKVDRKALPDPAAVRSAPTSSVAPSSELEQSIAALWQEILRVPAVGLDDNFFDLGGHSLLAVQAHRRLRESLQRDLAITVLFQFPTVRSLAAHLGGGQTSTVQEGVERAEGRLAAIARRRAGRRGGP